MLNFYQFLMYLVVHPSEIQWITTPQFFRGIFVGLIHRTRVIDHLNDSWEPPSITTEVSPGRQLADHHGAFTEIYGGHWGDPLGEFTLW
jgi:hypothetical protein